MDIPEVPRKSGGDAGYAAAQALLGAIPVAGAAAGEILGLIVMSPLEKRRDEWMKSVGKLLKDVAGRIKDFDLDKLSQNPSFVTTAMQATTTAIKNHQQEKLDALRNAIINSALPNPPSDDLQLVFLNLVDIFTPCHLRILKYLSDPKADLENIGVPIQEHSGATPSSFLEKALPELKGQRELYDVFTNGLYTHGLLEESGNILHRGAYKLDMYKSRTTKLGNKFLKFISSPVD